MDLGYPRSRQRATSLMRVMALLSITILTLASLAPVLIVSTSSILGVAPTIGLVEDAASENSSTVITRFEITNARFEPKRFDPSADETTTLYFELSEPAKRVNIEISDGDGNPVWGIKLKDVPAGLNGVVWSGLDEAGNPVASGKYKAKLVATSYEDERARAKASVRVK